MLILIFFHLGRSDPVRASVDPTTSNTSKIEVIWELPSTQPKGIFFAAHGCQHSAGDFWLKNDDTCPGCLGLPEELRGGAQAPGPEHARHLGAPVRQRPEEIDQETERALNFQRGRTTR